MKINVPICFSCEKPHFGRKDVNQRCVCDSIGNWGWGEIEEEEITKTIDLNDIRFLP